VTCRRFIGANRQVLKGREMDYRVFLYRVFVTGAPKRYILDKIDKGFTNISLIS